MLVEHIPDFETRAIRPFRLTTNKTNWGPRANNEDTEATAPPSTTAEEDAPRPSQGLVRTPSQRLVEKMPTLMLLTPSRLSRHSFANMVGGFDNEFDVDLVLEALKFVMENNMFQFGDTYWKQTVGTAVGTPPACVYAFICCACHENKVLLPSFSDNILFYKRATDDVFVLWQGSDAEYAAFQEAANSFGTLKWEFTPLGLQADFLDVTMSLTKTNQDRLLIHTKSFSKAMNLYLCNPLPVSAHPPGVLKSPIFGRIRAFHMQCCAQFRPRAPAPAVGGMQGIFGCHLSSPSRIFRFEILRSVCPAPEHVSCLFSLLQPSTIVVWQSIDYIRSWIDICT